MGGGGVEPRQPLQPPAQILPVQPGMVVCGVCRR
eukprot:COSAG01_NODE_52124_length_349_cov_0.620000_2_plen_33_part_01